MNQPPFTASMFRFRAPFHASTVLGISLCAAACGTRYDIGDLPASTPPQSNGGASAADPTAPASVSALSRIIVADGYDVDATLQLSEPDPRNRIPETSIVPLGDVDGDGYGDWAENFQIVYGVPRPPAGVVVSTDRMSFDPGIALRPRAVAAGDVNGDGYADVFFNSGCEAPDSNQLQSPDVFLVLGGPERVLGPQPIPTGSLAFSDHDGIAPQFTSELSSQGFTLQSFDLQPLGDLDGDGLDDFSITTSFSNGDHTYDQSVSYLIYGSRSREHSTAPAARLPGVLGVFRAGDVNGDGSGDLFLVGADRAYLWSGGSVRPSGDLEPELDAIPVEATVESASVQSSSVEAVGDLDHDGFDEFILRGHSLASDHSYPETTLLFYGSADIFARPLSANAASAVFDVGMNFSGQVEVRRAGDWNADGFDDLLIDHFVWAPGANSPSLRETLLLPGTAQRWSGTISLPPERPGLSLLASGSSPADYWVGPAGDLDGDGYDDLMLRRALPGGAQFLGQGIEEVPGDLHSITVGLTDVAIKYGRPLGAPVSDIH